MAAKSTRKGIQGDLGVLLVLAGTLIGAKNPARCATFWVAWLQHHPIPLWILRPFLSTR